MEEKLERTVGHRTTSSLVAERPLVHPIARFPTKIKVPEIIPWISLVRKTVGRTRWAGDQEDVRLQAGRRRPVTEPDKRDPL